MQARAQLVLQRRAGERGGARSRDYHDPKQKRKTKKVIEVDLAGSIAFAHGWRARSLGGIGKRTVDSDLAPSRACLLNGWANLRRMNDKAGASGCPRSRRALRLPSGTGGDGVGVDHGGLRACDGDG